MKMNVHYPDPISDHSYSIFILKIEQKMKYKSITTEEMRDFLSQQGFKPIVLEGCYEEVYGKIMMPNLCLRIYTSISSNFSREKGKDAIRLVLAFRNCEGKIKIIGKDKRVHRVEGWRKNLQSRIDNWKENLPPICSACGGYMQEKKGKNGNFLGCSNWPNCKKTQNI